MELQKLLGKAKINNAFVLLFALCVIGMALVVASVMLSANSFREESMLLLSATTFFICLFSSLILFRFFVVTQINDYCYWLKNASSAKAIVDMQGSLLFKNQALDDLMKKYELSLVNLYGLKTLLSNEDAINFCDYLGNMHTTDPERNFNFVIFDSVMLNISFVRVVWNKNLFLVNIQTTFQDGFPMSIGKATLHDLKNISRRMPLGICVIDSDLKIQTCNKNFLAILDSTNITVGSTINSLIHEDLREEETEKLQQAIMESRKTSSVSLINLLLTQDNLLYREVIVNSMNDDKTILFCINKTPDSKQQRKNAKAQRMQAMGALAGGIAHDFNNLLTAMIGFCDLLLLRHSPADQSFADIMQIKQNANRAANLVRQLLAFARRQTIKPKIIDVVELFADLTLMMQRLVGSNINIELNHGKNLGNIRVDQGQLEQVIINILVNARDAMKKGGDITVDLLTMDFQASISKNLEMVKSGEYVEIRICDTGCGISTKDLNNIFEPFFSTKEGSGTGLGLSTAYGIVKQMDGYITAESELTKGTIFRVYIPKYKGSEPTANNRIMTNNFELTDVDFNTTRYQLDTKLFTILLVEDELPVRMFCTKALKNQGYNVIEALNGQEALAILNRSVKNAQKIDLMITDIIMPIMDGVVLFEKAIKITPNIKTIFISGYAKTNFRSKIQENDKVHFISKPFNLRQLTDKVQEILSLDHNFTNNAKNDIIQNDDVSNSKIIDEKSVG